MNQNGMKLLRVRLMWMLVVAGLMCLPAIGALGQETPSASSVASETDGDTATQEGSEQATPQPAPSGKSSAADDTAPNETAAEAPPVDDDAPTRESSLPAGKTQPSVAEQATGGATAAEATSGWRTLWVGTGLLALFIVPVLIGNYLANRWKMPDHGWKISLVIGTLAASILICTFGRLKFGPDLAGGITLVYELEEVSAGASPAPGAPRPRNAADTQIRSGGREFKIGDLIAALKERLDPDGTKEITIREYGPAVEIIIPQTGEDEMEFVKRRITDLGQLEFRITADINMPQDRATIDQARKMAPSQKALMSGANKVAEWVTYDEKEFGPVREPQEPGDLITRMVNDVPEALVLMDPMNVTGEYLTSATKGLDNRGRVAVHFSFDRDGAGRFRQLTSQNKPSPATRNAHRRLGIVLDKKLISAPNIIETISDRGIISGGTMSDQEVEHIIEILNAGSLPAALNKTAISEHIISPTLGADTVEKGKVDVGGRGIHDHLLSVRRPHRLRGAGV
jgi:SecD/SecF fusion protein